MGKHNSLINNNHVDHYTKFSSRFRRYKHHNSINVFKNINRFYDYLLNHRYIYYYGDIDAD